MGLSLFVEEFYVKGVENDYTKCLGFVTMYIIATWFFSKMFTRRIKIGYPEKNQLYKLFFIAVGIPILWSQR